MDPDLFAAFSNGNPLSCSTQPLIQPIITQSAALQARLTTPEPEPGMPLTKMQEADPALRSQCIAALADLAAAAGELNSYISSSLETVLDDLSMRKAAVVLDQQSGVTTGSVSAIVEGILTDTITEADTDMQMLDQAITEYEAGTKSLEHFDIYMLTAAEEFDGAADSIRSYISAETTEKARIEKQHKAMSNTLRAQNLMADPDTKAIMQALGLS